MLDDRLATRQRMLEEVARGKSTDLLAERMLAEAYWSRYPDVAADAVFGRTGKMGIYGAREHYQRHGRHEGRIWDLF